MFLKFRNTTLGSWVFMSTLVSDKLTLSSIYNGQWGVWMFEMQQQQEKTQSKKQNVSVYWTLTL